MSRLEFYNQVDQKKRELIQTYDIGRRATMQRGEPDPFPEQPLDCPALFLMSVKNHGSCTVGGAVSIFNYDLAARRMVGDNFSPTHRIATAEEIRESNERSRAQVEAGRAAEAALNNKRILTVKLAEPQPRSTK